MDFAFTKASTAGLRCFPVRSSNSGQDQGRIKVVWGPWLKLRTGPFV